MRSVVKGAQRVLHAAVCGIVRLAASGCSAPSEEASVESPWKSVIDAERQFLTDYEWDILRDYEVTDAELRDAKQKAEACMHAKGLKYEVLWPYGSRGGVSDDMSYEEYDRHLDECEMGTMLRVESYHLKLRGNPNNEDFYQLIVTCLVREGVVDKSFTADDLRDSSSPNYPPEKITHSPEWIRCEQNPLNNPDLHDYIENQILTQ